MADNKGSSSNPAKGLVAHLDQNRSLQQDRFAGSSSTGSTGAQSFRSRPAGPNAAGSEAAFTDFTNHGRGTQLGGFPMTPPSSINTAPGGPAIGYSANTAWADEFLHLRSQPGADPRTMAAQLHEGNHVHSFPGSNLEGGQMTFDATHMAWPSANDSLAIGSAQSRMGLNMPAYQNRALGLAGMSVPTEQHTVYPANRVTDEARLAETAEQAMEAAFAAYDQDFEGAMDSWLQADGSNDLENHVQNIRKMEEMKLEDPSTGTSGSTTNGSSTKPDAPVSHKSVYDRAMMKHASDIVITLTENGSAETKAKMSGSSFQGLMRAVASGKAAVVDDNFIDTSTGEVIDDLVKLSGLKSDQESNDIGNGLQAVNGNNGDAVENTDNKGKGKMRNLDEQEQEQEHREGPA